MKFKAALLAVVGLLGTQLLIAQPGVNRGRRSDLMRRWRTAGSDTAALHALGARTSTFGETGGRVLLDVARDSTLPDIARYYALWAIQGYFGRWTGCYNAFEYTGERRPYFGDIACGHQTGDSVLTILRGSWTPRSEASPSPVVIPDSLEPSLDLRIASIDPAFRDTIRAELRAFVARTGGRVTEVVRDLLAGLPPTERDNDGVHRRCLRGEQASAAWDTAFPGSPSALADLLDPLCTQTGPPVIAAAWKTVGMDSASLNALAASSMVLRDRRLSTALLAVASDERRPPTVRVSALLAFSAELQQGMAATARRYLTRFDFADPPECVMPSGFFTLGIVQENGAEPLTSSDVTAGLRALRQLASRDGDRLLQRDAGLLADCTESVTRHINRSTGG